MAARALSDPTTTNGPRERTMPSLFDPIRLGAIQAPNRILMAPMTRARGTQDHVPTPMMTEYYAARASAGLIISEAIGISREGMGWPYATGLWSPEQIAGWRVAPRTLRSYGAIRCSGRHAL